MPDFDAQTLIAELDRLGMKLTALELADGTFKVYRWRMSGAREHAKQIELLWNSQVGEDQARIDLLAVHILRAEKAYYGGGNIVMPKGPPD
jgi:hypothetical protein